MSTSTPPRRSAAGLFDVRNIIAALMGIYGIVLVVMAIVDPQAEKSNGLHLNLWTGIGLIIFAALMALWAWLRPIMVPEEDTASKDQPDAPAADEH